MRSVELANSECGHVLTRFLGNGVEEINDVIDLAFELRTVFGILRRDSDRTVIEVTATHINASHRNESDRSEVEFLGPEDSGVDDIKSRPQTAIGPKGNAVTKTVHHENLLGFGNTDFPRKPLRA